MELPEFRVTLTRLKPGETAYPQGPDVPHYEFQGQRSKFGGKPDLIQGDRPLPACQRCKKEMTFVAQIDSVEHDWPSNPHAVDSLSDNQKWMFCDVGMIYVFYCFDCIHAEAFTEFY
jgi:hypothetical protein